jgi:hypothetical protein
MRLNRMFDFLSLAIAVSTFALPTEAAPGATTGVREAPAAVGRPVPEPAPPAPTGNLAAETAPSRPTPPVVAPAGSLYVCVTESGGVRRETAIEFPPGVGPLCAKHPEMSPCQYERNVCRRSGGRVYAAGGVEITLQTEADYDRKVMRVIIN